jgi:uncharacterized protein YrrD
MTVTSMTRAVGRPVIALDTAVEIGKVKAFVVTARADSVLRIQIAGRKKHALFADWSDLESFGDDAVMVRQAHAPSESDDDRDLAAARGTINILGSRVLATSGFEHGVVAEVAFDDETGVLHEVVTSSGVSLAAASLNSLGRYALVVTM